MKSLVIKRSIVVHGRKTSVSVEDIFWNSLREIASNSGTTLSALLGEIEADRVPGSNLSSAVRVKILSYFIDRMQDLTRPSDAASVAA